MVEIGAAGAPRPTSRRHLDRKSAGLRLCRWSRYLVNLCPPRERRHCYRHRRDPSSSRKTIQHLEGGIIREILVADGDVVRAGQTLISLEDTKARAEAQSLQGQLWEATAREARLQAEQRGEERVSFPARLEMAQMASASVADVLAGQQAIFETRRQVFQSQAAVNREKRSQVEKEIEGLRAQESAAVKAHRNRPRRGCDRRHARQQGT